MWAVGELDKLRVVAARGARITSSGVHLANHNANPSPPSGQNPQKKFSKKSLERNKRQN
jgi:hypothetical protein